MGTSNIKDQARELVDKLLLDHLFGSACLTRTLPSRLPIPVLDAWALLRQQAVGRIGGFIGRIPRSGTFGRSTPTSLKLLHNMLKEWSTG